MGTATFQVPSISRMDAQMVCMNYPNLDSNMKHYLDKFDKAGTAFILKPKAQRNIPVTIPVPPAQNPALSLAPKAIDLPM